MARLRLLLVSTLALALAGCAEDFLPESYLDGLRILAITADPVELGPDESVTLRPTVHARENDPVASTRWSFCPLTLGASQGYACALAACETPLTPAADGSVTGDPTALARACLELLGASPPPGFEPGALPDLVETVFRLTVTAASGDTRTAVKRVPLHTRGAPAARNQAPVIDAVEFGGIPAVAGAVAATLAPGGEVTLTVRVDPASLETYQDGNGRSVQESVVVWFYASAGRLDDERRLAPVAETTLVAKELEPGQDEALVYVVARDLRGGEAVAGPFRVAIAP